jgi:cob(I)alamin adenosyltransferase
MLLGAAGALVRRDSGANLAADSAASRVLYAVPPPAGFMPPRAGTGDPRVLYSQREAMGHRLSKITTRTGDSGETGLGDGSRVTKDSARIAAIGDVDELNSAIGVLLAEALPAATADALVDIQHDLFDLGGELSIPGHVAVHERHVKRIEALIETLNGDLPPLKEFILPGGTRPAAFAHLARTICRRAERTVVALARAEPVSDAVRIYLNRLSDLLFVLGRVLNRAAGVGDVLWQKGKNR